MIFMKCYKIQYYYLDLIELQCQSYLFSLKLPEKSAKAKLQIINIFQVKCTLFGWIIMAQIPQNLFTFHSSVKRPISDIFLSEPNVHLRIFIFQSLY